MKLDPKRKVTQVYGRAPLRYLQDGHGFDGAERYLGRFTDNGDPIDAPKAGAEGEGDLSAMKVADLKEMAKAQGIEGADAMKKAELVEALTPTTNPGDAPKAGAEGEGEDNA